MDGGKQFGVVVAAEIVDPCQDGLHGEVADVCPTCTTVKCKGNSKSDKP